jgi:hypothetical protein
MAARRAAGLPSAKPPDAETGARFAVSVAGKEQGYVILPLEAGPRHVVFLAGETAVANFYAAATAAQLLEEGRCVYHSAAVIDYPDVLGRSYLLKRWNALAELDRDLDGLERMSLYKLNKAYAGYEGRTKAWHQPDALFRTGVAESGSGAARTA